MFCPFINYEKKAGKLLSEKKLVISTAESCTGGLISSLLTDISGSSDYIKSNFITYANEAKEKYLFVSSDTLEKYGAVSEQTAKEMAKGLLKQTNSDCSLGITGIAGPTGGTKEKPVGLCYIGIANKDKIVVKKVLMPSFLPRRFMKFCFAKKALYYLKEFLEG
ncbi:CinA family protein [bacterium]|nr:CinA family protein [bacterium]